MRKALLVISLALLAVGLTFIVWLVWLILSWTSHKLEHEITLVFASPRPGVSYFLMCQDKSHSQVKVERLKLTDGRTARVKNDDLAYWSRHIPLRLCAMPNEVAKDFDEQLTEHVTYENRNKLRDWLGSPAIKTQLQWSEQIAEIPTSVSLWNPQKTIIRRYQVTHTLTELKVDLVEERNVYSWMDIAVFGGAGVLSVTVVAWFIVWLVRKARRP